MPLAEEVATAERQMLEDCDLAMGLCCGCTLSISILYFVNKRPRNSDQVLVS